MSDISRNNVAGPSIAQSAPEERDETGAPPQARSSSCLPITSGLLGFMGIGSRARRPEREEDTRRQQPSRSTRNERPEPQPASARQLTRSIGQRWATVTDQPSTSADPNHIHILGMTLASTSATAPEKTFAQQMQDWASKCERESGNWYADWFEAVVHTGEIAQEVRPALAGTVAILVSNERSGKIVLKLQSNPIPEFPPDLSRLAHLSSISIISGGLQSLPESIDALHQLHSLSLINNPLQRLPASMAGLTHLHTLEIIGSRFLKTLPDDLVTRDSDGLQGLVALETLSLKRTGLEELPKCLLLMENLKLLELDGSPLKELPSDIGSLTRLDTLSLQDTAITGLPPSLGTLSNLTKLDLQNCRRLTALPENIGALQSLKDLDLRGCSQLRTLPVSIRDLPSDCNIKVPPRLRTQLDGLRPPASAQDAGGELLKIKMAHIDAISQWMMDQVIYEARNPFLEGNPSTDPSPGNERMTVGEVPALRKLVFESKQPDLVSKMDISSGKLKDTEDQPLNIITLSKAVEMWRAREIAVAKNPYLKKSHFAKIEVDHPPNLLTGLLTGDGIAEHPPMTAPDAAEQLRPKDTMRLNIASQWMEEQVTFEGRNPFLKGNPRFRPDKNASEQKASEQKAGEQPKTLGELSAVRTLLQESMNPDLPEEMNFKSSLGKLTENDPITANNLSTAVAMWRARELAVLRKSAHAKNFGMLDIAFPDDLPSPASSGRPAGGNPYDAGAPSSSSTRPE